MTLAEQFYENGKRDGILLGKQEGLQEGLLEGRQEGLHEGLLNGFLSSIELTLTTKFGESTTKYMTELRKIKDVELLKDLFRRIQSAQSLTDVEKILEK